MHIKIGSVKMSGMDPAAAARTMERVSHRMFGMFNVTLVLLLILCPGVILGFNVDVNSKIVHSGPPGTCNRADCMFGFSVAQHREQGQAW